MIGERNISKQRPPAPTASTLDTCPTQIKLVGLGTQVTHFHHEARETVAYRWMSFFTYFSNHEQTLMNVDAYVPAVADPGRNTL